MNSNLSFLPNQSGATSIEYGLIAGGLAIAIFLSLSYFDLKFTDTLDKLIVTDGNSIELRKNEGYSLVTKRKKD